MSDHHSPMEPWTPGHHDPTGVHADVVGHGWHGTATHDDHSVRYPAAHPPAPGHAQPALADPDAALLGLAPHQHFDPAHPGFHHVSGDPAHFTPFWHQQHASNTCAVVSQEFVLNSFGIHFNEKHLAELADRCGFYAHSGGTPLAQVGSLLEAFGCTVHREQHATMREMVQRLEHGDKVVVAVDAHRIWHDMDGLGGMALVPAGANHAVQVIGVTDYGTDHASVVLNDPGSPDGCGMMVPLHEFTEAWAAGDNFMAFVPAHIIPTLPKAAMKLFPALAESAALSTFLYTQPEAPADWTTP